MSCYVFEIMQYVLYIFPVIVTVFIGYVLIKVINKRVRAF